MIVTCILSSTVAAAVVTSIKEIVLWRLNRKAKLEDRGDTLTDRVDTLETTKDEFESSLQEFHSKEKKAETSINSLLKDMKDQKTELQGLSNTVTTSLKDISKLLEALKAADKYILGDQIQREALQELAKGKITFEKRKRLHDMWNLYHYGLGANGDLDKVMSAIDNLDLDLDEDSI